MYKNILNNVIAEFNANYKRVFKEYPSLSVMDKRRKALARMVAARGFNKDSFVIDENTNPFTDSKSYQYKLEVYMTWVDICKGIERFYIKDERLFDFLKETKIKKKEVNAILDSGLLDSLSPNAFYSFGILGKEQSYAIACAKCFNKHVISVLTDEMNYTFCEDDFDYSKNRDVHIFNLIMNFLFYINAFPECVIDGVPSGIKQNKTSKTISLSDKVISHTTCERGFVRPHFRSGYFRHLNSDYFVNCKGQVRFIASTMVKGKAKTVISNETI